MAAKDRLEMERSRRTQLGKTVRDDLTVNLDDLDIRVGQGLQEEVVQTKIQTGLSKLKEAREYVASLPKELGDLNEALESKLKELGYKIEEARAFTTWERIWLRLGAKDWAEKSRRERQYAQTIDKTILEIGRVIEGTILRCQEIEDELIAAKEHYEQTLIMVQGRIEKAQPEYEKSKEEREKLDAAHKSLQRDLDAGVFSATERPAKLKEYDELEKELHALKLDEDDRMVVIKVNQEALKDLTETRNAAAGTINAVHQMKRQLHEKRKSYKPLWDRVMTSVRTTAELERFHASDQTFNKVTEICRTVNVKAFEAATQVAADRLEHASIEEDVALKLLTDLTAAADEFKARVSKIADQVQRGKGAPGGMPSGSPKEPAEDPSSKGQPKRPSDLDN